MIKTIFFLLAAPFASSAELPPLPGFPNSLVILSTPTAPAPAAPVEEPKPVEPKAELKIEPKAPLLPPKIPARPQGTLDTAGEVARDLAIRVEYFEHGQSYYRAYTKGSHTPEENKAFVKFLEDYENELGIAKRVHALLGVWLEKKSAIKD